MKNNTHWPTLFDGRILISSREITQYRFFFKGILDRSFFFATSTTKNSQKLVDYYLLLPSERNPACTGLKLQPEIASSLFDLGVRHWHHRDLRSAPRIKMKDASNIGQQQQQQPGVQADVNPHSIPQLQLATRYHPWCFQRRLVVAGQSSFFRTRRFSSALP
ncbi:hypothetical protein RRG08_019306 [Elysia crispata]|uniref:Uncharacterized protein n=1 Tax=Elysia crispata TaxID=231223 RepID=A0AAE0YMB9_9GAST|nr:hypothetical protein RRG08_019306 [Elysia crispata]